MPENSDKPRNPAWKVLSRILDLVYPSRCELCGESLADGRSLCGPCSEDLPVLRAPFCEVCGEMFHGKIEDAFSCPNCKDLKFSFEFARPVLVRDPRSLKLVRDLKYRKRIHLAEELGRFAARALEDERFREALEQKWPLVPVPLHRSRQHARYFNQAMEISRVVARISGLPLVNGLKRTRRTNTQTRLSRAQRLQNLRGAFAPTSAGRKWGEKPPRSAILVDDVFTTGSTVDACAKALRQAGFQRVCALTVMRG